MRDGTGDETAEEAGRDHPRGGAKHPAVGGPLTFGRPPRAAVTHKDAEDPGGNKAPGMDRS
jgi:hypothetical protein